MMKRHFLNKSAWLAAYLTIFSSLAFANNADKIAETAEQVTPIMNGQNIPHVTLQDVDGNLVSLKQIVSEKPTVIVFYRGGWCPYCSSQLAGLSEIEDKVIKMGYQIVAISPDSPERLKAAKVENDYKVRLLSDSNFDVTSHFGIGFFLPDETAKKYRSRMGIEFVELDGTSRVALPVPAVYVVDKEGLIHFNYVNPNFRVRLSPELLYQATKTLAL